MQLRSCIIATVVAFIIVSAGSALAGGCLKDTRQIKVGGADAVRLSDYLCRSDQDPQARLRVQFQRLRGLAPGVVLNGGSAPWLGALYGNYQVADNEVQREYKALVARFGSAVREVDKGGGESTYLGLTAGTAAQVGRGELSETRGRPGQVVRSFQLVALPDIPLVEETLQVLNEQTWPASLNMSYAAPVENVSPLDTLTLWRYLTAEDARQYADRLSRYNALIANRDLKRGTLPKSMELLNYLTANGWPEHFLYASVNMESCGSLMDFTVNQYAFDVEVAIIENISAKPLTIDQLVGQAGGSNQLRRVASSLHTTIRRALPGKPMMLAPSSRLIVPLRLMFAGSDPLDQTANAGRVEDRKRAQEGFRKIMASPPGTLFRSDITASLRGKTPGKENGTYSIRKVRESFKTPSFPTHSDFAFGPEWALAGLTIGGEMIAFDSTARNVILITASTEAGSCPILYSWDARGVAWIRHGKVLHQARTLMQEGTETVQFDGLVHRFRIAEEELERATIRRVSLQLELDDGRTLTLMPEPRPRAQEGGDLVAELYANDEIEITFTLPADLDPAEVIRSSFTVSGYYDRYAALMLSAAIEPSTLDVRSHSPGTGREEELKH